MKKHLIFNILNTWLVGKPVQHGFYSCTYSLLLFVNNLNRKNDNSLILLNKWREQPTVEKATATTKIFYLYLALCFG